MNCKLLTGLGACALSAGLFLASFSYRNLDGGVGDPGALFLPRLVMGLAFAVGVWTCLTAFLPAEDDAGPAHEDDDPVIPGITAKPVITVVATALYLICFQWGGYLWATPVYLAFVLWLAGIRRWRTMVMVVGGFWLAAYFVFYRLLEVPFLSV